MVEIDSYSTLELIARKLEDGEPAPIYSVRELLSWFGQKRRGAYVVANIRSALAEHNLVTNPDFESVYIDSEVAFEIEKSGRIATDNISDNFPDFKSPSEAIFRIRLLKSANTKPTSVDPNTSILEAISIMVQNDYSQLPVMNGDREVKGLFTARRYAKTVAFGGRAVEVRECMEPATVISDDAPLLTAIGDIVEKTCVLVKRHDETICGIVTETDLSMQFQTMTEPFLLISQIESQIRSLIFGRCRLPKNDIQSILKDNLCNIDSIQLTFGNYLTIIQNSDVWRRASTGYSQRILLKGLEEVRQIRNDTLHFNADPTDDAYEASLDTLRGFVTLMDNILSSPIVDKQDGD